MIGLGGDNLGPESCVGGEYTMEANEMEAGSRDQDSQALQEFQGSHHDMRGAIAVGGFELQDDVTVWCASQAFVAQGGTGDVSAVVSVALARAFWPVAVLRRPVESAPWPVAVLLALVAVAPRPMAVLKSPLA